MITNLDPKSFDARIQEIYDKRQAEELARQSRQSESRQSESRQSEARDEPTGDAPKPELPAPVKLSHVDLLRRALRHLYRLDSKIVWTLLHRDIYHALLNTLGCKDLAEVSEACYVIYDKLPHVDWRPRSDDERTAYYFYEVPHGEYLGSDSWSALVQSQLLHNPSPDWTGVPVVQSNRYKAIKSFNVHTCVTGYILHCTDLRHDLITT